MNKIYRLRSFLFNDYSVYLYFNNGLTLRVVRFAQYYGLLLIGAAVAGLLFNDYYQGKREDLHNQNRFYEDKITRLSAQKMQLQAFLQEKELELQSSQNRQNSSSASGEEYDQPLSVSSPGDVLAGGASSTQDDETILSRIRRISEKSQIILEDAHFAKQVQHFAAKIQTFLPVGWPIASGGRITSPYGERFSPFLQKKIFHTGIDIAAAEGSNIVAVAGGRVRFADYISDYGYTVIIDHDHNFSTLYAHNSDILVNVGQTVRRGQVISKMGFSGRATGSHVHFEVRYKDKHINPYNYIVGKVW